MSTSPQPGYRFGRFQLDPTVRELNGENGPIHLERQVFDVLLHLIEHRDRIVTKTELIDEVWGDRFVSESALTSRIKDARQAIGDDGRRQHLIKTIHGVGYRFVGDAEPMTGAAVEAGDSGDSDRADDAADDSGSVGSHARLAPPKPTIGRNHDVAAVIESTGRRRLVSLIGPGGVGKTHLLLHVGDRLTEAGARTVLLRLAEVHDVEAIGPALLDACGAAQQVGFTARESALRYLATQRLVLLVDNAEHLRLAVSDVIRSILYRCPDVTVLATSRERLSIVGEYVHRVEPLPPEAGVELFVESARAAGADLSADRDDVRALCRRLDGVPLALELVAARTALLSIPDLATNLASHLTTQLAGDPAGDGSGDPARHRSLEAALAWSLDALDPTERRLLSDLSVAAGSFDLAAASALATDEVDAEVGAEVGSDVTAPLLRLCERSLVVALPSNTESRFRLLEPIRLFAADDDGSIVAARARHVAHYTARAEEARRTMIATPAIDESIDQLRADWSNLRAAFGYAESADDLTSMARITVATGDLAELRLMTEVGDWADRVLTARDLGAGTEAGRSDLDPALAANVAATRARLAAHRGDLDLARELLADVPPETDDLPVLMARIWIDYFAGRLTEAEALSRRALERMDGGGGLTELGILTIEIFRRSHRGAVTAEHVEPVIRLARSGGPTARCFAHIARAAGRWQTELDLDAIEDLDQAIEEAEALGLGLLRSAASSYRSVLLASHPDRLRAATGVREQLVHSRSIGFWTVIAADLPMIAKVMTDLDETETAARLIGLRQVAGYDVGTSQIISAMVLAVLEEVLPADRLATLLAEGRELTVESGTLLALDVLDRRIADLRARSVDDS